MNTLICGRMKEGKTTLALYLARQHSPGVVVWDPRSMIDGVICYGPDDLEDAIQDRAWRNAPIVYRFDNPNPDVEFNSFCAILFPPRFPIGHFSVVIDEASELQGCNSIHAQLSRAVRQHPRSVNIYQTTHSLQDWHRASKDLVSDLYCFALIGRSLRAAVEFMDGDEKMEETIRTLPRHQCIHWQADGEPYTVLTDPSVWYKPLNTTMPETQQPAPARERREWVQ